MMWVSTYVWLLWYMKGKTMARQPFRMESHFEHLMCKSKNLGLHDVPEMKREVCVTARIQAKSSALANKLY